MPPPSGMTGRRGGLGTPERQGSCLSIGRGRGFTQTGTRIWRDKPRPGGKRPVAACALLARSRPVQDIRCETPTDPAGSGGVAGDPAGRGDGGLRQQNRSTPTRPRHPDRASQQAAVASTAQTSKNSVPMGRGNEDVRAHEFRIKRSAQGASFPTKLGKVAERSEVGGGVGR